MAPIVLAAQVFEVLLEKSSHLDDAICHTLDFSKPLLIELWTVQDLRSNASTVDRRVRI